MNFFEHQDAAKKRTGILVGLLIAAVIVLIAISVLMIGAFLYYTKTYTNSVSAYEAQQLSFVEHMWALIQTPIAGWVALGVIGVVTIGSLFKFIQLSSGGSVVAEALGGQLIDSGSSEFSERKVLNVVQEMAIASGNPVPQVYLLPDTSINAFAAGQGREDAVIGVTKGCVEKLSRDELQGVIAHEFSHIHNGDMRLNLRLIAILHGILLIGLIGYHMTHAGSYRSYNRRYHSSRGKGYAQKMALGVALMVVGYGGTFFGSIIKAAVSRQREFLADASAVQFTRNPDGISGALKKIGGLTERSQLESEKAAEFSHMYFGEGVVTRFRSLMATHPPLEMRIQRIDPRWQGRFEHIDSEYVAPGDADERISGFSGQQAAGSAEQMPTAEDILDIAGEATPQSVSTAQQIISGLPAVLNQASREAFSARAIVYGLLLDKNPEFMKRQLELLKRDAHPATFKHLLSIVAEFKQLETSHRLPLLNMCLPALKQLSEPQYKVFKSNLVAMIQADRKISLFEWSLYRICTKTLEKKHQSGSKKINALRDEVITLFNCAAIAGENKDNLSAINAGLSAAGLPTMGTSADSAISLKKLDQALNALEKLSPLQKPRLLKGLLQVCQHDGLFKDQEKELFRAVADTLDCPIPPLG